MNLSSEPKLTNNVQKPEVGITWYDAMYFCNLRGARLPTEAEWGYAAKGPEGCIFPWRNTFAEKYIASTEGTYVVGSIPENISWSGVYDLSGNAAQWVEDRFLPYAPNQNWPQDSYIEISRVVRGGSWLNRTLQLTTFDREFASALEPDHSVGFRCARTSDPSQ